MDEEKLAIKAYIKPYIDNKFHILDIEEGSGCEIYVTCLMPEKFEYSKIWDWGKDLGLKITSWHQKLGKIKVTFVCNKQDCEWCSGD